ncbi:glutaminase A [soil metagenome]
MADPGRRVSTGSLPSAIVVGDLIAEAHERFRDVTDGMPSGIYPALQRADPGLFGISVAGVAGEVVSTGDAATSFPIMSVAKPFTFALVCDAIGHGRAMELLGSNATGQPFNSVEAVERAPRGKTNPLVNSGAIATIDLVAGPNHAARWDTVLAGLSRFAGRNLVLDIETYESAARSNDRNRALAHLLESLGALSQDPEETVDLYTRQSCLAVTAQDLAIMGATLADGGVNPKTARRVVSAESCRYALTVMTTAGLYETSGDWLYRVGLPGKSGIVGGIVTVSPGKGGLGTYSPPLDAAGNSVRGQLVAAHLSSRLGLDIFASAAHREPLGQDERPPT